MSMWLNLARVSKPTFDRISAKPSLLDAIFFDDDADAQAALAELGIEPSHSAGVDYRSAHEGLMAMAEAMGDDIDEDEEPIFDNLGVSGELDYDAGYGPAFYIEAGAVKETAVNSIVCHMDDETKAMLEAAASHDHYVIGVIS